eukprot:116194-Prymnesium_polylepis.1
MFGVQPSRRDGPASRAGRSLGRSDTRGSDSAVAYLECWHLHCTGRPAVEEILMFSRCGLHHTRMANSLGAVLNKNHGAAPRRIEESGRARRASRICGHARSEGRTTTRAQSRGRARTDRPRKRLLYGRTSAGTW